MERPLQDPNLPQRQVRFCIAALPRQAEDRLLKAGVAVLSPLPDFHLPPEEQTHADLLFCHPGGSRLFLAPSQTRLQRILEERGFSPVVAGSPGCAYPADIGLNVAVGDDFAAGNFRYCEPLLLSALREQKKKLIQVRQGYAKCSLCFVTDRAFITEDAGIAKALRSQGADVLGITKGDVYLSERHYGFFGGAAGKIAPDVLAVNGSLNTHQNGKEIIGFLSAHGVAPLELQDGQISDVGGILPLTEEGTEENV